MHAVISSCNKMVHSYSSSVMMVKRVFCKNYECSIFKRRMIFLVARRTKHAEGDYTLITGSVH